MNVDSFFWQGKGAEHDICEDYALAKDRYMIISDGCSSSPDTDFGSRLLVKAAEKTLNTYAVTNFPPSGALDIDYCTYMFGDAAISRASNHNLDISDYALDATLLVGVARENELFIMCFGDGVIATIENENVRYKQIEYISGAPYYLNYSRKPSRDAQYIKEFTMQRRITHGILNRETGDVVESEELDTLGTPFAMHIKDFSGAALIMSDGIASYSETILTGTSKIQQRVPLSTTLMKLFQFKNMNGTFIKRRAKKFIAETTELGWRNYDDVSVAAIHMP